MFKKPSVLFVRDNKRVPYLTKELEILHHVVSEMNKLKRRSFRPLSLPPGMTEIV